MVDVVIALYIHPVSIFRKVGCPYMCAVWRLGGVDSELRIMCMFSCKLCRSEYPTCRNPECVANANAYYDPHYRCQKIKFSCMIVTLLLIGWAICACIMLQRHVVEDECIIVREKHNMTECTRCTHVGTETICTDDGKCIRWEDVFVNHPDSNDACAMRIEDQVLPAHIEFDKLPVPCYFHSTRWDGMALKDGRCASTEKKTSRIETWWAVLMMAIFLVSLCAVPLFPIILDASLYKPDVFCDCGGGKGDERTLAHILV